jgi:hypothetical protein
VAVRFTADGQDYTRTLSPTVGAAFTVLTWVKIVSDRDYYTTAWCLDSNSQSTAVALQTSLDGVTMRMVSGDGDSRDVTTMTVGAWYCFATVRTATGGAAGTVYTRYGTDPAAMSQYTFTGFFGQWSDQATFGTLRIAESIWGGEWLNGSIAFTKLYTRALSNAEITSELSYYNPVSTTGLYGAWSFWGGPSTADLSGNSRTLSGGTGTSTDTGPAGIQQSSGGGTPGGATVSLGKTTDGTQTTSSSTTKITVSTFTATSSGTLTAGHARVWLNSAGSAGTRVVVYADSAGAPGALLAVSDEVVVTATTEAVRDYTFSGTAQAAIVSGTPYWIGLMWADPGTPSVTISRDSTANMRWERSGSAAPTWSYPSAPDPFGTPEGSAGVGFSGPADVWVDYVEPTGPEPGRMLVAHR